MIDINNASQCSVQSGDRVLRIKEVLKITGLCKSTLYERMKQQQFPLNFSLGGKSVGWLESEVHAWLEDQIKQRHARIQKPFHLRPQTQVENHQGS